jgi:hypothetical protein
MMLAPLLYAMLAAGPGAADKCDSRCTRHQVECTSKCSGSDHCLRRCGDDTGACLAQCRPRSEPAAEAKPKMTRPVPCGMNADHTMRPCTDKELLMAKQGQENFLKKAPKDLICQGPDGQPTICEDKLKKAQADPKFEKKQAEAMECFKSGGERAHCPDEETAQKMRDLVRRLNRNSGQ